jgi:hypothetical protein
MRVRVFIYYQIYLTTNTFSFSEYISYHFCQPCSSFHLHVLFHSLSSFILSLLSFFSFILYLFHSLSSLFSFILSLLSSLTTHIPTHTTYNSQAHNSFTTYKVIFVVQKNVIIFLLNTHIF